MGALLLLWCVELPLGIALALLVAAWFWAGSDTSLATVLQQARHYLPEGYTLEAEGVQGSVRRGGRIGLLRGRMGELRVEARDVELRWEPRGLLDRRLQLDRLNVAELRIDDRSPSSTEPVTPPQDLRLPIDVDLQFAVAHLAWVGPPAIDIHELQGRYEYRRNEHKLSLARSRLAYGSYSAEATLQAAAPLTLDLRVHGEVLAPVGERSLRMRAQAQARGPLGLRDGVLDMQASLRPASGSDAMHADVDARIAPWAAQPVLSAKARFAQFDAAWILPQAPRTALTGTAEVVPVADGWRAQADFTNARPGPWDKSLLPMTRAQGRARLAGTRWMIESLDLRTPGNGRVRASGSVQDAAAVQALSGWQIEAVLDDLDPATLHSQLAPTHLSGKARASATRGAVDFEVELRPTAQRPKGSPVQSAPTPGLARPPEGVRENSGAARRFLEGLRLQQLTAQGRWQDGWLRLRDLSLKSDDATIQAQGEIQPATRAGRGQVNAKLPGAQISFDGALAARDGQGRATLRADDLRQALRWITRLPGVPTEWSRYEAQGRIDGQLQWQGGWQGLLDATAPALRLRTEWRSTELVLRGALAPGGTPITLRDLSLTASGTLAELDASLATRASQGPRSLTVATQARGGRAGDGTITARLQPSRLQAEDNTRPGVWSVELPRALSLRWRPEPSGAGGNLQVEAGEATLRGPVAGSTQITWEPLQWNRGSARDSFSSKGQLRGLTLGWLELLGVEPLDRLGLRGNLVLDAQWDIASTDRLRAAITLARHSGDLLIQPGDEALAGVGATPQTIRAGIRELRLDIRTEGDDLRASARWDSERAGSLQADFATRLANTANGWDWPATSPMSGKLHARLPQVGAWSVLAPPGWRVRGTLDADLALSGTREKPAWRGQLAADDLGLRSVVDGIEFGNGRLRATIEGLRLELREFSLQGAGGAAGGQLSAQGSVEWLADAGTPAWSRARMRIDARAEGLRVSARADRRLAVSGTLQAKLEQAQLDIEAALRADQALFILPDENTPTLGEDVVIKGARRAGEVPDERREAARAASAATRAPPTAPAGSRLSTRLNATLDLGRDFRLRGLGIDTLLAGTLTLRSSLLPGEAPRLTGQISTVRGEYRAHGQHLDIETGVLRFTGPYDNPALDILAIRPNTVQRVGVQITGTAFTPRVRLYSEPDLPEAEKLAWLVLGRSGANGGAEAALLEQAAVALLSRRGGASGGGGGIANRLGLDELSFSGAASNADGSAASATVTLGKRLSRNFYVAYEQSLAGTLGTFSIFYDLSRRFTLRARAGEQSAIDLIYTVTFD